MNARPGRVAGQRAVKITLFFLIISPLFPSLLTFLAATPKPPKIIKAGESILLNGVKLTPFLNGNDTLGSVDVAGARIVVTLQFQEKSIDDRPYYNFRLDPDPEKSGISLQVGPAKLAPTALRKSFEDLAPLTLDELPQASEGYRFMMFTAPPLFSVSFLFDIPEDQLAAEKVFSARFKIGPKEHAILVSFEK